MINGSKCWITNGGESTWYTVMAVTDPDRAPTAFRVHGPQGRSRLHRRTAGEEVGIKGSPTAELLLRELHHPADRIIGDEGTGKTCRPSTTRPTISAGRSGIAQGALDKDHRMRQDRKQFSKVHRQGIEFAVADMAMKVRTARLMVYVGRPPRRGEEPPASSSSRRPGLRLRRRDGVTVDAVQLTRWRQLHPRLPLERDARRQESPQICRAPADPASSHEPCAAEVTFLRRPSRRAVTRCCSSRRAAAIEPPRPPDQAAGQMYVNPGRQLCLGTGCCFRCKRVRRFCVFRFLHNFARIVAGGPAGH